MNKSTTPKNDKKKPIPTPSEQVEKSSDTLSPKLTTVWTGGCSFRAQVLLKPSQPTPPTGVFRTRTFIEIPHFFCYPLNVFLAHDLTGDHAAIVESWT